MRPELAEGFLPLVPSHGATSPRTDRSRFHLEFDWQGTDDPTAWLALPAAIRFMGDLLPGGWPALFAANHALALEAQGLLASALGSERPAPASMIGAMTALPLPPELGAPPTEPPFHSPTQEVLYAQGFEVPVFAFPTWPQRLVRVTCCAYNERSQYERLAAALRVNVWIKEHSGTKVG
jgi:isopenicillin-N epimerase